MPEKIGRRILVRGIVQGVGFRPCVYGYAKEANLTGWVCNSSRGVEIEVFGMPSQIRGFSIKLRNSPPPLSRIDGFKEVSIPFSTYSDFSIMESRSDSSEFLPISPDISICPDCQKELFDPNNRRYRYPFINCTNCGPRFTIIKSIPYDRSNTTMDEFEMCPACRAEYEDPANRRFTPSPLPVRIAVPMYNSKLEEKSLSPGKMPSKMPDR